MLLKRQLKFTDTLELVLLIIFIDAIEPQTVCNCKLYVTLLSTLKLIYYKFGTNMRASNSLGKVKMRH